MEEVQKAVPKKYEQGSKNVEGWEKILRNIGIGLVIATVVFAIWQLRGGDDAGKSAGSNQTAAVYEIAVNGKWVRLYNVRETDTSIYGEWRVPDGSERFLNCQNGGRCVWGEGTDESTATLARQAQGLWTGSLNYEGRPLKVKTRRR